ncbi:SAM-dependent methyltransferase [Streptomyces sp. NPDC032472]|uniref:THUMP-like domain-containing protein n=1 Tax=Streptomyces sp. NPDC032472 TaxID=3155018 RepID=UPI0033E5B90A
MFDPEAYSPPLSWAVETARAARVAAIKIAPGIPHEAVPAGAEAEWISDHGDVKEAVLWFGTPDSRPAVAPPAAGEPVTDSTAGETPAGRPAAATGKPATSEAAAAAPDGGAGLAGSGSARDAGATAGAVPDGAPATATGAPAADEAPAAAPAAPDGGAGRAGSGRSPGNGGRAGRGPAPQGAPTPSGLATPAGGPVTEPADGPGAGDAAAAAPAGPDGGAGRVGAGRVGAGPGAVSAGGPVVRATLLPGPRTLRSSGPVGEAPVGPVGRYLYEPDGAVIRAHLVAEVAERLGGRLIDPTIAYVTADELTPTPYATAYEITDVLPFGLKKLKALLREREVGILTVKKRGSAIEPEELRKKVKPQGPHAATVFLTRVAGAPSMLIGSPVSAP